MAEATTRRSPGRPAKQVQETKTVKKSIPIKRNETEDTHKEFEIVRGGGIVYMLPQKGVTIYDKEEDTVRQIRYCPNEPSIFVDEQSDNALKQSVIFRDGRLFVPKDKPNLRRFLEHHPENVVNGGAIFKEVNKKMDAEKELEKEFLQTEAVATVRDKDIQELLPVAIYFKININKPTSEIRYDLLRIAKNKPKDFIQAFDSPEVSARSVIQQAADYQIIRLKDSGCYWFDSNSLIVSVPVGQSPIDVMTRFCLTEKGAPVLSDLESKLEALA